MTRYKLAFILIIQLLTLKHCIVKPTEKLVKATNGYYYCIWLGSQQHDFPLFTKR